MKSIKQVGSGNDCERRTAVILMAKMLKIVMLEGNHGTTQAGRKI